MAENKAHSLDLSEFVHEAQRGEVSYRLDVGGPSVVVYSKSQGWRENDTNDTGWPFMADGAGEQRVSRTWWDSDTNTIVVVID